MSVDKKRGWNYNLRPASFSGEGFLIVIKKALENMCKRGFIWEK